MYKPEAKYDNLTGQFKINSMKANPKNGNSYYLGKKTINTVALKINKIVMKNP